MTIRSFPQEKSFTRIPWHSFCSGNFLVSNFVWQVPKGPGWSGWYFIVYRRKKLVTSQKRMDGRSKKKIRKLLGNIEKSGRKRGEGKFFALRNRLRCISNFKFTVMFKSSKANLFFACNAASNKEYIKVAFDFMQIYIILFPSTCSLHLSLYLYAIWISIFHNISASGKCWHNLLDSSENRENI